MTDESPHSRANRESWNVGSRKYQASHHDELVDDVLWGPSMPPERELRVLGPSLAGKDVLEVACGGGQSAVYLVEHGARVTGVDFSSAQHEHAREYARTRNVVVRFIESNVEDLSMLADESFDVTFSSCALGFVENIDRAFREVARVTRRGGLFAFSVVSPLFMITEEGSGIGITRGYFDRRPLIETDEDGTEVNFPRTYGDWHRSLTEAGFVVTDLVEPEPVPHESTYSEGFPLAKITMIPAVTIWRARKPRRVEL